VADLVVVTGGSGFLASWCVKQLIDDGYEVRVSLRHGKSVDAVRQAMGVSTGKADAITAFNADLSADDGWGEGIAGARYVLHVASPTSGSRQSPEELSNLTRAGTLRVVSKAIASGVERIVLTSSTYAMAYPKSGTKRPSRDENDWTDTSGGGVAPYVRAKTEAERAAWDFVDQAGERHRLATVNPAGIIGPLLTTDVPDSMNLLIGLLLGRVPGMPDVGIPFVDVRDVADLHLRAMKAPEAGGQRFIASGSTVTVKELVAMMKRELGPLASNAGVRILPDWLVRLVALTNPGARLVLPDLGTRRTFSAKKAETILGWHARPLSESLRDAATSLAERGLLPQN